ncbi:MAG: 3-phosphoshikimate 1-carboxyvinyltransferase [Gaiellaceae bacterium MAG52_C11]|nr:3-phosphoshikimate 1-carboxyvinyltransferase [Candidatus Gaiellasilicea maunaloa]
MKINPATALRGDIAVPGVKGISQRAVLLAGIADGESEIRGFGHAADTDVAIEAVRSLGVQVVEPEEGRLIVEGCGLRGLVPPGAPIDCRNAGTLMRLLSGILAGQAGVFHLMGDESLSSRDHERIAIPLRLMGARVETTNGSAPLTIEGARLQPILYTPPMASAQVKSSVLLAGLLAEDGPTTVVEPLATRDHTERMLTSLGVRVRRQGSKISVWPVEGIPPLSVEITGDFSSAAPFLAAAALLADSELRVHHVNLNPTRTAFIDVLERMGARVAVFERRSVGGEPVGTIEVRPAPLVATDIKPHEVSNLIDELPLFALLASYAHGDSVLRGAAELRAKETDRIEAVVDGLRRLGAHIRATEDGFVVRGVPTRLRGGSMDSRGDHRIAMLAAIAGLVSREGVEVEDAESVAVSFPGFYDLLAQVVNP